VKERLELQNLHTDHVTIQSELNYLIVAKVVMFKCRVFGGKTGPVATVRVFVWYSPLQRFGSGSNPNPEPLLTLAKRQLLLLGMSWPEVLAEL